MTKRKKSKALPAPEFPGKTEIVPPVENEFGECCYVVCMIPSTKEWAAYRRSGTPEGIKYQKLTSSWKDQSSAALGLSQYLVEHGK